jgi:hypothetical protein
VSDEDEEEDGVDDEDEVEFKHKKRKLDEDESEAVQIEVSEEQIKAKEDQEKKKADDLWSSFLKDVNQIAKKPSATSFSSTSDSQKTPINVTTPTQKVKPIEQDYSKLNSSLIDYLWLRVRTIQIRALRNRTS